jgi:GntR family transcriptional repressor for pyruvate dehydrogenase complex
LNQHRIRASNDAAFLRPARGRTTADLRESAEVHREIYRAIRARKPLEARRLMEKHLELAQAAQGLELQAARNSR